MQSGSLPVYLGVILLTATVVPGTLLVTGDWWQGTPDLVGTPLHIPIAAVILGAAVAAAAVRRRFTAALFLGVVGYSMAGLFVIEGAPDLALTQVAIESLTTVLFVLVLRRLPDRFESRGAAVAPVDPSRHRHGRRPHGVRARAGDRCDRPADTHVRCDG